MPTFENMGMVESVLSSIELPKFVRVRQKFAGPEVKDIPAAVQKTLQERNLYDRIVPGARIAVAVGSRQIANLAAITAEVIAAVRQRGAEAYIIPAMGSHGGATAEGQAEILATFGIDETTMGVPVNASMDVSYIGESASGDPVHVATHLLQADGVILINRVKPHPAFSGEIESGITKMSVIGLGKQRGADYCHQKGLGGFSRRLQEMSRVVFDKLPILFGVAILENPYDRTAEIIGIPAEKVPEEEPALLERARNYMPRIIPEGLDVLIVDRIGKNISGTGADPCVMCRFTSPHKTSSRKPPQRIVMCDLTEETHGAAAGMGQADFITQKLYEKIDYGKIYINSLTSTLLQNSFTPLVMPNDRFAIQAAVKTCGCMEPDRVRIVRIEDTLTLGTILASEAMIEEIRQSPELEIVSEPFALPFDAAGEMACGVRE